LIDLHTDNFIQELDDFNITYIYCSSNIVNHNRINIIIPNKSSIELTKKFFRIFRINNRVEEYYYYINHIKTLVYKKEDKWSEYQYNGDINYSDFIYKYLDDYSANEINYNIFEKPKILNIINKEQDILTNINKFLNIPPIKKDPSQTEPTTPLQIQYYNHIDKLDKLKDLLDSII
jgi:hypothetical protein